METIKQSNCKQSGRCPPDFVYAVIWAQFGLFSVFSVVSIYQQANHASVGIRYAVGEVLYLALSIASKGILGAILLVNILFVSGSIDAELVDGGSSSSNTSAQQSFDTWRESLCLRGDCDKAAERWFQCGPVGSNRPGDLTVAFYQERRHALLDHGLTKAQANDAGACAIHDRLDANCPIAAFRPLPPSSPPLSPPVVG